MSLVGLVLAVHRRLADAGVSHAFGGALALGYVAQPRGTVDVDVNVFVPVDGLDPVLGALEPLGLRPEGAPAPPVAGVRLRGGTPYPVDLFPSLSPHYAEVEQRRVSRPFGADAIALPFLSAEDLALFKLSFGRAQDWVDLESIAVARPDLDVAYIERQLVALRGPTLYPRVARLRQLLRRTQP